MLLDATWWSGSLTQAMRLQPEKKGRHAINFDKRINKAFDIDKSDL
jgi:hypothetical protein